MAGDDLIVEANTMDTACKEKGTTTLILYSDSAGFIDTILRVF